MPYGRRMQHHPEKCPQCGAALRAGGVHMAYYECGGKLFTRWDDVLGVSAFGGYCGQEEHPDDEKGE